MSRKMKKVMDWTKLNLPFITRGKAKREGNSTSGSNLGSKLNVNEEYKEAFRTKSYMEMWSKVQDELGKGASINDHKLLLEPRQETLIDVIKNSNIHHFKLLLDYFEATLEACNTCELLLQSVHQTRSDYRKMKRVFKIINQKLLHKDNFTNKNTPDNLYNAIFHQLVGLSLLNNPLSILTPLKFRELHDKNMRLLCKLTSKRKRIKKRSKFINFCKRIGGYTLVISHSAIVIALLVIAFHSMVGILAAPGILTTSFTLIAVYIRKNIKGDARRKATSNSEKVCAQLDVVAKGVFIMVNDLDTISRLVMRLQDEVQHRKLVAELCAKNLRKNEVLKEVVKEFKMQDCRFLEQLEELENHIYLCFHTINRSRRLVIEEILVSR